MEIASQSNNLTPEVIRCLREALESIKIAQAGGTPDFVIGLNKIRFRRFTGGPIVEFALRVPKDYNSSKSWSVLIHADPRRIAAREYSSSGELIDLWWHSLTHKNLQWKEYQALYRLMREKLNINEDRIYVNGECGNGMAAMALGLNFADHFAECSVSLGNSYRRLAGNALNLPFIFVKGGHNEDPLVGYYDFAAKCFEYFQCRHFVSSKELGTTQARGSGTPQEKRENSPQKVRLMCETLQRNKAYWVQIDGRTDENILGILDAVVDDQTIIIKTDNVDAYTLDLADAPVDATQPVEIIENGLTLEIATGSIFRKQPEKYREAGYIKNRQLSGPIEDVFTDQFVVVYPTLGSDSDFLEQSKRLAKQLAQGAPCIKDSDVSADMIEGYNIVLVGNIATNKLMAQASEQLPIQFKEGRIWANRKCFDANDVGAVFIHPNPLNPNRAVAIFSASSPKALRHLKRAYSQIKNGFPVDVGVFEVMENGKTKWHIREKFNTVWDWHDHFEPILFSVEKEYPSWRWRQWVAKMIQKQMNVDVVICEEHFKQNNHFLLGDVTGRDLFNTFRNDWIVKIRLKGQALRELIMVPFSDLSKREVGSPIIEGIRLVKSKNDSEGDSLGISEIKKEQDYTVAFPYRCINGQRLGLVLKDYDIIDQKYLFPLLTNYFDDPQNHNLDEQISQIKLNIF